MPIKEPSSFRRTQTAQKTRRPRHACHDSAPASCSKSVEMMSPRISILSRRLPINSPCPRANGNQPRNWYAFPRDNESTCVEAVEKRQTLLLEFGCTDRFSSCRSRVASRICMAGQGPCPAFNSAIRLGENKKLHRSTAPLEGTIDPMKPVPSFAGQEQVSMAGKLNFLDCGSTSHLA